MKRVKKLLLALTPALLGLAACADPSASSSSPSSSLEGSSESSSSLVESSSSESPIPEVGIAILAPEKTTLEVGESITLQTKVENMPEGGVIGFSSSDPSVASVAQDGTLTALKAGTTQIIASIGEVESEPLTITVENPELIVEILAPAKSELKIGETLKLEAKVENNIDGLPLVYSSSDEGVISVDQEGNVTALSSGKATIALTVGEASDSVELSVSLPDAESIEIHLDATAMYVGQTLTVEATILPSTASQEYTVSVSNEIYLGVDGHEITANRISVDPIVVTVSTPNGLTDSAEVTIGEAGPIFLSTFEGLLTASDEVEQAGVLSSAHIEGESTELYSAFTGQADYEFYSDSAAKSTITTDDGVEIVEKKISDGVLRETTIREGLVESIEDTVINDEDPAWDEMSSEEALGHVNLPQFPDSNGDPGISAYLLDKYFSSSGFGASDALDSLELVEDGSTYTLSCAYESYSTFDELSLSITIDESGLIVSGSFSQVSYALDWDSGAPTEEIENQTTFSFTQTSGEREASDGHLLDESSLLYQDYGLYFSFSSYGTPVPVESNEFETGDRVYLYPEDILPTTAFFDVDKPEITVSPSTGVSLSVASSSYMEYWASISFSEAGHYTFTVKTSNVTKTIEADVIAPALTGLNWASPNYNFNDFLPSAILAGSTHEARIVPVPSNASFDLEARIVGENTAMASVTVPADDPDSIEVSAQSEGEFTVEVYDSVLGSEHALTKTVKVYPSTDEGITSLLCESEFANGENTLEFASTGPTSGTYVYSFLYDGSTPTTFTGTFEVAGGEVSMSEFEFECDDGYTEFMPPDYEETFVFRSMKTIDINYQDDYYDTYRDHVYML